jgi:hypothetical protein
MALAVVARMPTLVEAHIAVGALRASGIEAQVFDANFGGVEAPVIEALGGFRIMADEADVVAARQALRTLQSAPRMGDPVYDDEPAEPPSPWAEPPAARRPSWLATVLSRLRGRAPDTP